jgi:hypothetical protein
MCGMKLLIFTLVLTLFTVFICAEAATVRFYDDSLNLVETRNYEEGTIIDFSTNSENKRMKSDNINHWYLARNSMPLDNYKITKDVNLYSVPSVKEINYESDLDILGGKYMLMNDIKLANEWQPIGSGNRPFTGVFNGGGHKISGLWVDNASEGIFIGLFGRTYGAVIRDISVSIDTEKGGFSGRGLIGGIVGSALNTKIINSNSEGLIKGGRVVGGIAGYTLNSIIKESYSSCDIEASDGAGGVVGIAKDSYFENIRSSGTIILKNIDMNSLIRDIPIQYDKYYEEYLKSEDGLAGGIAGYASGITIVGGHFTGKIYGRDYTGGIAGEIMYSGISGSSVNGTIEGRKMTGGIAGYIANSDIIGSYFKGNIKGVKDVGGILGYQWGCTLVADSYAQGEIEGENNVGGLAGSIVYGVIDLSHFSGSVKGLEYVGGIAGYNKGWLINNYSEGTVKGDNYVRGMIGWFAMYDEDYGGGVLTSYSSADVSGKENVGGIAGAGAMEYTGIKDVYFTGKVKGEGKYTGGIIGYNESFIKNSYVLGPIEGGEYAGGIAGYSKSEGYGHNLAANSLIKGENTARIVAFIDGEQKPIPNNFALSTLGKDFTNFSEGDARNGTSKTAEELKQKETYSSDPPDGLGWKFGDGNFEPWTMEGSTTGYPILYWQNNKPGYGFFSRGQCKYFSVKYLLPCQVTSNKYKMPAL